jgi:hypothetical protein
VRLARLALAESLLLALTAGGLGLLVAFGLLQTFLAMAPPGIPGHRAGTIRLTDLHIEGRPADFDAPRRSIRIRWVTPQYLETFRDAARLLARAQSPDAVSRSGGWRF